MCRSPDARAGFAVAVMAFSSEVAPLRVKKTHQNKN
jgi:hypothetical protein